MLHNVVHLLFGVAGLLLGSTPLRAKNYLFYGGIAYGVLFFYGIVISYGSPANFVPFNAADNALHIALAGGHDDRVARARPWSVVDRGPPGGQGRPLNGRRGRPPHRPAARRLRPGWSRPPSG